MSRRNYPSDSQDFEVNPKRAKLSGKNPQRLSLPSSSVLDITGFDSPSTTTSASHRGLKAKEISASVKWEGAEIIDEIQESGFVVKFEYTHPFTVCDTFILKCCFSSSRSLKDADFRPSNSVIVLFVTEADYIGGCSDYRRKVARFYTANKSLQTIVVVQRSELSSLDFLSVQELVIVKLGLALIPLRDQNQLPGLLTQLANLEKKTNPFKFGQQKECSATPTIHKKLIQTLSVVPGLGEKKARALLTEFKSLQKVASASKHELAKVVGQSQANGVYSFFHQEHKIQQ